LQRDNFSLVTANLLPEIADWQRFANEQPSGTAVMVMPSPASPLQCVYGAIAAVLRERGKVVKFYAATE